MEKHQIREHDVSIASHGSLREAHSHWSVARHTACMHCSTMEGLAAYFMNALLETLPDMNYLSKAKLGGCVLSVCIRPDCPLVSPDSEYTAAGLFLVMFC